MSRSTCVATVREDFEIPSSLGSCPPAYRRYSMLDQWIRASLERSDRLELVKLIWDEVGL